MRKLLLLFAMVLSLNLANRASAQVYGSISFNTFYNELSPYGRWVNDMDYGQVWIANAQGFEPYYNDGHWAYTNYGWTWVSDYPWGWAPFHYGRWAYLPSWGWAWVPGYEWGPAWVSWCQNDGYFGWAPLGPGYGYYRSFNAVPHNYWRFVRQQYITGPELRERIVRPDRNPNLFRNASFINNREERDNVTYNIGPRRESVERITRQRIETRPVAFTGTDEKTTVEQKQVRIYRPEMKPRQTVTNNGNATQPGTAIEQNRLPKNNPITKGEAVQQGNYNSVNNALPPSADDKKSNDNRPVRMLPKDRITDDKNGIDNQQADDRRRMMIEKQQAAQAQKNNELRPVQNNQPDVNRQQAQDEQRRQLQQAEQRRQDQLKQQQDLERRQQQQLQQEDQRKQQQAKLEQQRRDQQLQQQQANELRQQRAQQDEQRRQAQLEQQRRDQQQRDNELRQQQREQQRQQQMEQRRQQNEQRQNDLRQQRMQQQQDNFQRQSEQRQQRSFERPVKNSPNRNL